MSSLPFDIVTVGGGLGASAFAGAMARQGMRVLILEKETQFRDRVRGEYIVAWGVAEAKELGIRGVAEFVRDGNPVCGDGLWPAQCGGNDGDRAARALLLSSRDAGNVAGRGRTSRGGGAPRREGHKRATGREPFGRGGEQRTRRTDLCAIDCCGDGRGSVARKWAERFRAYVGYPINGAFTLHGGENWEHFSHTRKRLRHCSPTAFRRPRV
jgi:hypothetical protein